MRLTGVYCLIKKNMFKHNHFYVSQHSLWNVLLNIGKYFAIPLFLSTKSYKFVNLNDASIISPRTHTPLKPIAKLIIVLPGI